MRKIIAILSAAFVLLGFSACSVHAQSSTNSATWSWTPPTTFADGSAIPTSDAITYDIFVGTAGKGSESSGPTAAGLTVQTWTGTGYAPGAVVCGVVTAIVNGAMSSPSNEACKSFPDLPSPPSNLAVK